MQPTEIDTAWAAGLFEGEGSFSVRKTLKPSGKKYGYLRMQLDTTDKDVLDRFHQAVQAGNIFGGIEGYKSFSSLGVKRVWKWACSGTAAWAVAERFRPYLGQRRLARLEEIEKGPICNL